MIWKILIGLLIVSIFTILLGFTILIYRNAKASIKPNTISLEREIEWNKSKDLWLDFDLYDKKEYEIKGKDGYILHAMSVESGNTRGTGKYVIILHGHTSNRYGSVKYVNSYIKLGFSCIIYDSRSHGANEKDICTLGYIESEDLKNVIEDTRSRFKDIKILGLHGESMGSSTALCSVRFQPPIDFIVADCGFTSCYDVVRDGYGNIHMQFLVPLIRAAGRLLYHADLIESNAMAYLKDNKYPILFIHGAGDTFIKPYHSEKLRSQASKGGAYTELVLVEGAGHARSRYVAGFEKYTGYIESFLKKAGIC